MNPYPNIKQRRTFRLYERILRDKIYPPTSFPIALVVLRGVGEHVRLEVFFVCFEHVFIIVKNSLFEEGLDPLFAVESYIYILRESNYVTKIFPFISFLQIL